MSSAPRYPSELPVPRMTPQEYLEWEREQPERHEYFDGRVYAQTGASFAHNRIVSNLVARLDEKLRDRPCDVFANDLRFHVEACNAFYYPDVIAVCGDIIRLDDKFDTILNPQLIIEVSSSSTRGFDGIVKRSHYRSVESVIEYLLIDQFSMTIERARRGSGEHWDSVFFRQPEDELELQSVGCSLKLADIYRRVEFPQPPSPTNRSRE